MIDLDRLKSQLLTSGLSQKDQPLYQVINQLIDAVRQSIKTTDSAFNALNQVISNGGLIGPTGSTGLPGPAGIDSYSEREESLPSFGSLSAIEQISPFFSEGIWTPTITAAGGSSGQTYSSQIGYYQKIGKLVIIYFRVQLSNAGTLTGGLQVGGLPFITANLSTFRSVAVMNWGLTTTPYYSMFGSITENVNTINIVGISAAVTSVAQIVSTDIANNTVFAGSMLYPTP